MTPITRRERDALHALHAPHEAESDRESIALQCEVCGYVRVVELGTSVSCRHGGEWHMMVVAPDQQAARLRARTQGEAWKGETSEQLHLGAGE